MLAPSRTAGMGDMGVVVEQLASHIDEDGLLDDGAALAGLLAA